MFDPVGAENLIRRPHAVDAEYPDKRSSLAVLKSSSVEVNTDQSRNVRKLDPSLKRRARIRGSVLQVGHVDGCDAAGTARVSLT